MGQGETLCCSVSPKTQLLHLFTWHKLPENYLPFFSDVQLSPSFKLTHLDCPSLKILNWKLHISSLAKNSFYEVRFPVSPPILFIYSVKRPCLSIYEVLLPHIGKSKRSWNQKLFVSLIPFQQTVLICSLKCKVKSLTDFYDFHVYCSSKFAKCSPPHPFCSPDAQNHLLSPHTVHPIFTHLFHW